MKIKQYFEKSFFEKYKIMKKLTLLTLVLLTFFACRKNIEENLTTTTTITPPIITEVDYEPAVIEVIATLFGEVYDESGTPISNAAVTLDNNNTNTDDKGRFVFKDISMNKLGAYVEVNKNGFFPGSDRFFPEEGSVNYVKITLLDKSNIGNFPSGEGALISSPEGISIDFPANGVVDADGNPYEGTVEVAARWIDPTATNLQEIMPGGLQGLMPGGVQGNGDTFEEVALASFGMMAVELEGSNGEALNLGNDKKATLTFPVPTELLANAPATIPLWYFNESVGMWVIEGSATLQGAEYIGEVSHFSFWNCDAPFDVAKACGIVLSSTGTPLANANIKITILSSGVSRMGWTNSNGEFSGKLPANEILELNVFENWYCTELYTTNIGPIPTSTDTTTCFDLGTFNLTNTSQEIDITATVLDCAGSPVTNGWLEINLNGNNYSFYIEDGSNVSMILLNCTNQSELTVLAGNIDDLKVSDQANYNITYPLDLGTITACDNTLPEWLIVDIEGDMTTYPSVSFGYDAGTDTLTLSAQIPGPNNELVQFSLIDVTEIAPASYDNSNIQYSNIVVPSTTGGFLNSSCGIGSCTFSQLDIQVFGAVGELVTGTISGTLDFYDSGTTSNVTKDIDITFSIFRD